MDEKLREILNDGEQVLWSGSPAPFALLDRHAGNGRKILIKWISVAVLASALIIVYMMNNDPVSPGFLTVVIGISLLLILSPLVDRYNILGTRYWITDQRVIMMNKEKTCYGMELADIDTWKRVRGMSDRDCLVLGSSIFDEVKRQLRWRAVHPKTAGQDQAGRVEGMILYGPEDADGASAILQNVAHESVK